MRVGLGLGLGLGTHGGHHNVHVGLGLGTHGGHRVGLGVRDSRISGSDMMTIMYVLGVKTSMNEAKHEFRTSMLWNCAWSLLQLSLNCFTILLIFSNLCTSVCGLLTACAMTCAERRNG